MRTLLPALLLAAVPGLVRAQPSPAGEYRLEAEVPRLLRQQLGSRLSVSPAPGGGWRVVREGWPARLEGTAALTREGQDLRLEVEFPRGLIARLDQDGARLAATWRITPASGRITGELRHTTPAGRTHRLREAGRVRSPYLLPWPGGRARLCVQGNRGFVSHPRGGWDEHSFDFAMPVGSPVCAARAGVVTKVDVSHHGQGKRKPANVIYVRHDDGTVASYVHLRKGGSRVSVGQRVAQGQHIGDSGNVGPSLLPHLHFMVAGRDGRSIPTWFDDVAGDGVPRTLGRYRSANTSPR